MKDKRKTVKISDAIVYETFSKMAEMQDKTHTQLLRDLMAKDFTFESNTQIGNTKFMNRIEKEGE